MQILSESTKWKREDDNNQSRLLRTSDPVTILRSLFFYLPFPSSYDEITQFRFDVYKSIIQGSMANGSP